MIVYILKSTICLAILLLFYKWALEDVVMHKIKRVYLLGALILSLLVPIMPVGYSYNTFNSVNLIKNETITLIEEAKVDQGNIESFFFISFPNIVILFFLFISGVYFFRFIKNIVLLLRKSTYNKSLKYHSSRLVLLEESISPHTFLDKIFINKQEYLSGRINEELLTHEQAHADQRHSFDVIFIEILICIFWFNPLFKLYKQAIQLNHEFLADEVVIKKYQKIKKYQYHLLDTIKSNNSISLASNINFSLTKKRLEMMTKKSTARRKNLLVLSMLPMTLVILIAFGRPIAAQSDTNKTAIEQKQNTLRDSYFKDAMIHYIDKDGNDVVKKYNSIPIHIKNRMMLPPPPPAIPGGKQNQVGPLKKGTIVSVKNDGSIIIGGDSSVPPPPPPIAPKPPKAPKKVKAPKAPKTVKAPKPPKPPKVIKDIDQGK